MSNVSSTEPIVELDDRTITYLQMIQNNISRMSNLSGLFKGFSVTLIATTTSIAFSDNNSCVLPLSYLLVLWFIFMDLYYLKLERQYRFLYEEVRLGKKRTDFNLALRKLKTEERVEAKINWRDLIKSPSFWLFYPPLIVLCIIIAIISFSV